mgnify:CR=1 FL=1
MVRQFDFPLLIDEPRAKCGSLFKILKRVKVVALVATSFGTAVQAQRQLAGQLAVSILFNEPTVNRDCPIKVSNRQFVQIAQARGATADS